MSLNPCTFEGCGRPRHSRGLCSAHRRQRDVGVRLSPIWEHRFVLPHPTDPLLALVPLAPEPDGQCFAVIDASMSTSVEPFSWKADRKPNSPVYARARVNGRGCFLHVLLWTAWDLPKAYGIDHRNRDGLDCRRDNLRAATAAQNRANTAPRRNSSSKFKGVTWHRVAHKWQAAIKIGGTNRYLGLFLLEDEAAKAYDEAAHAEYGAFALLNFKETA